MNADEVNTILAENRKRVQALFAPYNPLTGEGSPIERERLYFDAKTYVLIPSYMASTPTIKTIREAGNMEHYALLKGIAPTALRDAIHKY